MKKLNRIAAALSLAIVLGWIYTAVLFAPPAIALRLDGKVSGTAPAAMIANLDDYRVGWELIDHARYSYWGNMRAVVVQVGHDVPVHVQVVRHDHDHGAGGEAGALRMKREPTSGLGSLGSGLGGRGGVGLGGLLRTGLLGLLGTLGLLVALVIRRDELDDRHLGGIADALRAELVDAGVTAGAVGELGRLLVEEERDRRLVANVLEGHAAEVETIGLDLRRSGVLGLGDDLLDEGTKGLGLRHGGLDATVFDQRSSEIGHHRRAVFAGYAQGSVVFIVTHCVLCFWRLPIGNPVAALGRQRTARGPKD